MRVSGDSFSGATCLKGRYNAIHQMNLYPMDIAVAFSNTCPLDRAMLLKVTDKRLTNLQSNHVGILNKHRDHYTFLGNCPPTPPLS